ncbi:MAG: FAD binding domain-containing protein, partial [Acidimicrobiales bacterium]
LPGTLEELMAELAERPAADVLAGGTDLMVEVNFGRHHPGDVVSLARVLELRGWRREGDEIVLGAALTYTDMMELELASLLPALAQAARTVGSPQIRNAGTLGGNLATGSPAGDTLPVLLALGARVVCSSTSGERELPIAEFMVGAKRTALQPGEVVSSVRLPVPPPGARHEFLKVGTRNAMVIAVCSVALVAEPARRHVRLGLGSVGPVALAAPMAEGFAGEAFDWENGSLADCEGAFDRFESLVASAAQPIDDHRSTAAYRRHAVGVCARRALRRALVSLGEDRPGAGPAPTRPGSASPAAEG